MNWLIAALTMLGAQEAAPVQVVPELPLSEARSATSWKCNFVDAAGANFSLMGRFRELPVGWNPTYEFDALVEGEAPAHFLGKKRVRLSKSVPEMRGYLLYHAEREVLYDFNFQFAREGYSLATVTRYTAPTDNENGRTAAFATGSCLAKFHMIGEKEAGR